METNMPHLSDESDNPFCCFCTERLLLGVIDGEKIYERDCCLRYCNIEDQFDYDIPF